MVKSSDDFKNGCIPTHWEIRVWRWDLCRPPLDNPRSASAARGRLFNVFDVVVFF